MKNPLRRPHVVYRKTEGRREGIHWIPGPEERLDILANVQPLSPRDMVDLRVEKGGRLLKGFIKIYTDEVLMTANANEDGEDAVQPDTIVFNGERYTLMSEGVYNMTNSVVSHNKYIAALEIQHAEDLE